MYFRFFLYYLSLAFLLLSASSSFIGRAVENVVVVALRQQDK